MSIDPLFTKYFKLEDDLQNLLIGAKGTCMICEVKDKKELHTNNRCLRKLSVVLMDNEISLKMFARHMPEETGLIYDRERMILMSKNEQCFSTREVMRVAAKQIRAD